MKIRILFLILCAACLPQNQPTAAPMATPTFSIATTPASTPVSGLPTPPARRPPFPTPFFRMVIDKVAVGPQDRLYASGPGAQDDLQHFAQWDGTQWVELGNGFKTAGHSLAVDSAGRLYTERLVESEAGLATAVMRWNAGRWEDITGNFSPLVEALQAERVSSNIPLTALAVDGADNLYAAGQFYYPTADHLSEQPMGYVARWDQKTWSLAGQGLDQMNILALGVSATGRVYVAGERPQTGAAAFTGFVAYRDNGKWIQAGTPRLSPCASITGIALDHAGGLYASCTGSEPGGLIFHWDGTDWTALRAALGGEAPAVYDLAVDQNGRLCLGGAFTSINELPARYIACREGQAWQTLGDGVNERVNALAFAPGGELYAVGFFTTAGGLPVEHAALWSGGKWQALGDR